MIITARQLEDLHRRNGGNGQVTLPYRARLTPLAADWVKQKHIVLGYGDVPVEGNASPRGGGNPAGAAAVSSPLPAAAPTSPGESAPTRAPALANALPFLWWCDGPCGPAKAALVAQEAGSPALRPLDLPADARQVAAVVKLLAAEVKAGRAAGGVLLVQNGALAVVFANRCPSLRGVLGTCLDAVDQGVQLVAANVLIVEHPHKTLPQMKNLLARFTRGGVTGGRPREAPDDVKRQLQELATCG